jgi:hypothetical protein
VGRFAVPALAGAAVALLTATQAESFTYGRLVGGQVRTALAYGSGLSWCLVDRGNTEFQINQSNTKAVISLAEVIYFDGTTYYALDGQTRLTFSSATGGTIRFKQPPASYPDVVTYAEFINFKQTYNGSADKLIVTFSVVFPNCTLPIYADYEAP